MEMDGRVSISIALVLNPPAASAITFYAQPQLARYLDDGNLGADVLKVRGWGHASLRIADKAGYSLRGKQQAAADADGVQAALAHPCADGVLANPEQVGNFQQRQKAFGAH
jgi:hypothetical protein